MKQLAFGLRFLTIALSVQAGLAMAHHASAPHYDKGTTTLIPDAVITEFKMLNPHSFVYFDAIGADNEMANWRCELRSATVLKRRGWTQETFADGLQVSFKVHLAWREDNLCLMKSVIFSDGTEVALNDVLIDAEPELHLAQRNEVSSENIYGQPVNISGDWLTVSLNHSIGGQNQDPYKGFDVSEAGIAAAESYDSSFDDPSLHCHPINIIQGWLHETHVNQITQLEDRIVLTYGYVDFVRTIYLNENHPDQIEPSTGGHSVGTWEEGVLTVDTVGFLPGVVDHRIGVLHGEQLQVTEKFYIEEASGELVRDFTLEDPEFLKTPYIGQDRQRASVLPYTPYDCVDLTGVNSLRPEN